MPENAPVARITVLACEKRIKGFALDIEDLQEDMSQMYRTMYGNKVNTDADTYIELVRNDGSKIIFIYARRKGINIINVQINTMETISIEKHYK